MLVLILSTIMIMINTIYGGHYGLAKLGQISLLNSPKLIQLNSESSSNSNTSSGVKGIVTFEGTPAFGNNSRSPSGRETIPNYKIEVFAKDGKTKIAQTTSDREGKFFVSLPAGHYIIYTQAGPLNTIPHDVVIKQGQIVPMELVEDIGVR
jgi:hypothetical protein